jgi:hypothetical protein
MLAKVLIVEADKVHLIEWLVDASFAVHPNMESHTGAAMILSKGIM